MKSRITSTLVGAALAIVLVSATAPLESRGAEKAITISRKEAKQLTKHASSPEDYQKVSAFFEEKTKSLEANAREHEKQATISSSGWGYQPKVPYPGGWVAHCRRLASQYRLEAQQARRKAEHYKSLAGDDGRGKQST